MVYKTSRLGNEAGIQDNGIVIEENNEGLVIKGLIVGVFKRGRFDRPMTITLDNVRSTLGFDPRNLSYMAVMDALNSGIFSIDVLRVKQ